MKRATAFANLLLMKVATGLLFSLFLLPSAGATQLDQYVMCRMHKIVRTIRIDLEGEAGRCKTTYTKAGVDREVGNGRSKSHCQRVLNNIRGNLEEASWKCKDVSGKAKITKSE